MSITRTGTTPGKYTVCTSATHPSSPAVGDSLFETDTGKFLQYQGATDTWTPPWNTAWGIIGIGTATANQGTVTTIVDLTSLTVTATVVANRRLRTTIVVGLASTVADDVAQLVIADGASATIQTDNFLMRPANFGLGAMLDYHETSTAGTITRKGRLQRSSGSGTLTAVSSASGPAYLVVEDLGPNGNPS